jgi:hypothetical protein
MSIRDWFRDNVATAPPPPAAPSSHIETLEQLVLPDKDDPSAPVPSVWSQLHCTPHAKLKLPPPRSASEMEARRLGNQGREALHHIYGE